MKKNIFIVFMLAILAACANNTSAPDCVGSQCSVSIEERSLESSQSTRLGSDNQFGFVASGDDFRVIHFAFDRFNIVSGENYKISEQFDWIDNHGRSVEIEGHTDYIGTREYNLALGHKRAQTVKNALVNLGIDSDMIVTKSYGKDRPVNSAKTQEARAQNRRATSIVQ